VADPANPSSLILFILTDEIVETFAPDENAPIVVMAKELKASLWFVRTRFFTESMAGE
jgi:hypothetical protein